MMFGNWNWGIGRVEWLEVLLSGFGCVWKEAVAPGTGPGGAADAAGVPSWHPDRGAPWSSSLGPRTEGIYFAFEKLEFSLYYGTAQHAIATCRLLRFELTLLAIKRSCASIPACAHTMRSEAAAAKGPCRSRDLDPSKGAVSGTNRDHNSRGDTENLLATCPQATLETGAISFRD